MANALLERSVRTELPSALVRISRECGVKTERLRAEQLVREAQSAWPGSEGEMWSQWLQESCECLALRGRLVDLSIEDAVHLAQDGALVVGGYTRERGVQILVGSDGKKAELADGEIDDRISTSLSDLAAITAEPFASDGVSTWLVVDHPEVSDADDARHLKHRPVERLLRIVKPEWPDISMILVFAFFAGVLNLATPIAVEALVNTVAFGRLLQPVLVLAILLFGFLAFAAVMSAMQTYVAEVIQRRLFARVAADLAYRLPRVASPSLDGKYGPELANRFLDVVTLQKVVASLLLDGVNIVLATLVGMTVLAFYHPWLLGFDVLLLVMILGGLFVLGRGAISSGIDESKMKYRLTAWFEDLMRCQGAFKFGGGADFAMDRANLLTANYLSARRSHFTILFRQITFVLVLQAIAGTVLLGGGGWLVIQGQLSLGQLVAAELIVTTILTSLAKLGKHLEGFYDVVASVDKLGALFDLGVERHDGLLSVRNPQSGDSPALEVLLDGVRLPMSNGKSPTISHTIEPGERVAVYGPAGSGKTLLSQMLFAANKPAAGRLTIGGSDPTDLRPDILRASVAVVGEAEVFDGTIADNVHLRRPEVSSNDVRHALEDVGLLDGVLALPDGVDTTINASGSPLTSTQLRLLMIARAMAGRPRLLVIDGVLDALPDMDLAQVVSAVTAAANKMTVVVTTGRNTIARRFDRVIHLLDGDVEVLGNDPETGASE
ncbi:MAG: ABC transporter ATP-binding protein [Planctomycetota bacterium]